MWDKLEEHGGLLDQAQQDIEDLQEAQDVLLNAQSDQLSETELLKEQLAALTEKLNSLSSSAVKEDYFYTNAEEIEIQAGEINQLLGPFCISGPGVFDFNLVATFEDETDQVMVTLLFDGADIVAQSQVNDATAPSNLALQYRARITDQTEVSIIVTSGDANTENVQTKILEKQLQVGYKLYGEGYNLIDELSTSCLQSQSTGI